MKKRGVMPAYLIWILMAIALLAIVMIAIFVLKGELFSLGDKIKNIFGGR